MIGAGEITRNESLKNSITATQDLGCTLKDKYTPGADEKAQCFKAVETAIADPADTENLSPEQQDLYASAGVMTAQSFNWAECGVRHKGNDEKFAACFRDSFAFTKDLKAASDDITKVYYATDGQVYTTRGYLAKVASDVKRGITPSQNGAMITSLNRLMPQSFIDFLSGLVKDGNGSVYSNSLRLFYDAMAQAEVNKMDDTDSAAAAQAISGKIMDWANGVLAIKDENARTEKAVTAYVKKADKGTAEIENAPAELFNAEALGLPAGTALDMDAKAQLSRLFYQAILSFRAKGGAGEDAVDIAKKTAAGVKEKVTEKAIDTGNFAESLRAFRATSIMEGSSLKAVKLNSRVKSAAPQAIIDFTGATSDPYLRLALNEFWNEEVEGNETYKQLTPDKKAAVKGQIINTLNAKIKLLSADPQERANKVALLIVESIGADGTPKFSFADRIYRNFKQWGNVATYSKLKGLYKEALADKTKPSGMTNALVEDQVSERVMQLIKHSNFDKLPLNENKSDISPEERQESKNMLSDLLSRAKTDGFDKKTGDMNSLVLASNQPLPKEFKKIQLSNESTVGDGKDKKRFGNSTTARVEIEGAVTDDISLGSNVEMNASYTPAYFRDPLNELTFLPESESWGFVLKQSDAFAKFKTSKNTSITLTGGATPQLNLGVNAGGGIKFDFKTGNKDDPKAGDIKGYIKTFVGKALKSNSFEKFKFSKNAVCDFGGGMEVLMHKESALKAALDLNFRKMTDPGVLSQIGVRGRVNFEPKLGDKFTLPTELAFSAKTDTKGKTYGLSSAIDIALMGKVDEKNLLGPEVGVSHEKGNDINIYSTPGRNYNSGQSSGKTSFPGTNRLTSKFGVRYLYDDIFNMSGGYLLDASLNPNKLAHMFYFAIGFTFSGVPK